MYIRNHTPLVSLPLRKRTQSIELCKCSYISLSYLFIVYNLVYYATKLRHFLEMRKLFTKKVFFVGETENLYVIIFL